MSEDRGTIKENGALRRFLHTLVKILAASGALFFIIASFTIAADSFLTGRFSPRYVFRTNFYAAAILLFSGVMIEFFPVILPKSKLLDHTTHGEYFTTVREKKRKRAFKLIYLGFGTIFVTATVQIILSFIL